MKVCRIYNRRTGPYHLPHRGPGPCDSPAAAIGGPPTALYLTPESLPEENVQAEFYHQCRLAGVGCFLEYKSWWSEPIINRSIFDAVIHKDRRIVALVEFKAKKKSADVREDWRYTRQCRKYKEYNLPLFLVDGMEAIPKAIIGIQRVLGPPATQA